MATVQNRVVLPQAPKITPQRFVEGTDAAGTLKTLYTADADGSKIVAIMASTTDNVAHRITLYLTRSAVDYIIGSFNLPASSGTNGAAKHADLLAGGPGILNPGIPLDNAGRRFLYLESGDTLRATFATAFTASGGEFIHIITVGVDF